MQRFSCEEYMLGYMLGYMLREKCMRRFYAVVFMLRIYAENIAYDLERRQGAADLPAYATFRRPSLCDIPEWWG